MLEMKKKKKEEKKKAWKVIIISITISALSEIYQIHLLFSRCPCISRNERQRVKKFRVSIHS